MLTNVQESVVAELTALLAGVDGFGQMVSEDSVMRVLESDDPDLPDHFIVLQPGLTEELERAGTGSVRERLVLNVTLMCKARFFASDFRAGRLEVKRILAGTKLGLATQGVQTGAFLPETPMLPGEGRRWAAHLMPVQVTYVQPLK